MHPDLIRAATRLRFAAKDRLVWRGAERPDPRPEEAAKQLLYEAFYLRPRRAGAAGSGPAFLAGLRRANRGDTGWDGGWTLIGPEPDGRLVVERWGVRFWADPGDVHPPGPPGARVALRVGPELLALMPGFYAVNGAHPSPEEPELFRLYWHLRAPAAAAWVAGCSGALNGLGLPFRLKVLAEPAAYGRADAGVLYIGREGLGRARAALSALHRQLQGGLRSEVPRFTRRLGPGLGLAEEPRSGESFGADRCARVVGSLWRSRSLPLSRRIAALEADLREAGLDPERPHLEPGSPDPWPEDP